MMKKQLLVSALAVGFLSGSTAFAAENPFTSIPKDHWAYAAVEQLVQDGLIDGYGDEDFRGEKNITRYESAQLLAKAMTNISKANDADKALIAQLQKEYSDELRSFDVRLAEVESKASSFKWTGEARTRYQLNYNGKAVTNSKYPKASGANFTSSDSQSSRIQERLRLNIEGTPAENLFIKGRISAEDTFNENQIDGTSHVDTNHRAFYIDRAELDWKAKNGFQVDVGRMEKSIGQGLIWWEKPIDGISIEKSFAGDKANIMVGWGDLNPGVSYYNSDTNTMMGFFANARAKVSPAVEISLGYLGARSNEYVASSDWIYYQWYNTTSSFATAAQTSWSNWGRAAKYELGQLALGVNAQLNKKLNLTAEAVHNNKGNDISYIGNITQDAWHVIDKRTNAHKNGFWTRLTYGDQKLKKAKNYNVYLEYAALGGSAVDSTGFAHRLNFAGGNGYGGDGVRGWGLGANYMLTDNANLEMNYYHMKPYDAAAATFNDYRTIFNTTFTVMF